MEDLENKLMNVLAFSLASSWVGFDQRGGKILGMSLTKLVLNIYLENIDIRLEGLNDFYKETIKSACDITLQAIKEYAKEHKLTERMCQLKSDATEIKEMVA